MATAKQITAALPKHWSLLELSAATLYRHGRDVRVWVVSIERNDERITVRSANPVAPLIEAAKVVDLLTFGERAAA